MSHCLPSFGSLRYSMVSVHQSLSSPMRPGRQAFHFSAHHYQAFVQLEFGHFMGVVGTALHLARWSWAPRADMHDGRSWHSRIMVLWKPTKLHSHSLYLRQQYQTPCRNNRPTSTDGRHVCIHLNFRERLLRTIFFRSKRFLSQLGFLSVQIKLVSQSTNILQKLSVKNNGKTEVDSVDFCFLNHFLPRLSVLEVSPLSIAFNEN